MSPSFIRIGLQNAEAITDPAVRLELEQLVAAIQQWASKTLSVQNLPIADITIDASQIVSGFVATSRGGTGLNGAAATDGDLLIGDTALTGFALAKLTEGPGITITNGPHAIEIAAGGSWVPLTDGAEPPGFITDGAGNLIFVSYTP